MACICKNSGKLCERSNCFMECSVYVPLYENLDRKVNNCSNYTDNSCDNGYCINKKSCAINDAKSNGHNFECENVLCKTKSECLLYGACLKMSLSKASDTRLHGIRAYNKIAKGADVREVMLQMPKKPIAITADPPQPNIKSVSYEDNIDRVLSIINAEMSGFSKAKMIMDIVYVAFNHGVYSKEFMRKKKHTLNLKGKKYEFPVIKDIVQFAKTYGYRN
jgi:hypothetical protein